MKRALLAALALALLLCGVDAEGQKPARMDETGWDALGAPAGCAAGYVPYVNASLKVVCSPTVYAPTTNTTTVGTLAARNVVVTALPASGSVTVTPTLSKVGSITTVAGASLVDGDYFTIEYAAGNTVPIEFDATPGNGTTGGRVPYIFAPGDTADQIRDGLITLLNTAAGTSLTASSGGAATVSLVLDTPGAAGGTNTENVTNAGFAVTGFVNPTAATTYTYSLQACLADGTCNAAGAASPTAAGHATLSASNFNRLSWSAVAGSALYKIRRDVGGATQGVIWSGTALTADDTGLAGDGTVKPVSDLTGTIQAGNFRTDAAGNIASGYMSQNALTTGSGNIASGYMSQNALTTGSFNIASGYMSQYALTTGNSNVASGTYSQYSLTTGNYNTASGVNSQFSLTTGFANVASGYASQQALTTGNYNVASGYASQYSLTTGSYNVASGFESGSISGATPSAANALTTGSFTTFIGYRAGLGSPTQRTNATAIGASAYVDADNRVVLGDGAVVDVWAGSTGQARLVGTGLRLNTGTRPTCDATTRGLIWYVAGGAGVADTCEVCRKDNADAYAWVSLF